MKIARVDHFTHREHFFWKFYMNKGNYAHGLNLLEIMVHVGHNPASKLVIKLLDSTTFLDVIVCLAHIYSVPSVAMPQ